MKPEASPYRPLYTRTNIQPYRLRRDESAPLALVLMALGIATMAVLANVAIALHFQ